MQSPSAPHTYSAMQSLHEYLGYSSPISMSRRSRIQRACIACRRRKIKCNGNLDGCAHCAEKEQKCRYEPVPDDEKLKARSYKRQLIKRRQQTQVFFDRRQFPEHMLFATYGMAAPHTQGMITYPVGFLPAQPTAFVHTPQQEGLLTPPLSSPSTSNVTEQGFSSYLAAASMTSPNTSSQLQSVTGTSSFPHPIPAPLVLESLNTPGLTSSLSSPTLSVSSSSSSLLTPMSESFSEVPTPLSATFPPNATPTGCVQGQGHFHDFVGGLELYNVPCMAAGGITTAQTDFAMMDTSASSAESSAFSSPDQYLLPLPSSLSFVSTLESAAAFPALAGARV